MELQAVMTAAEKAQTKLTVENFNKTLTVNGRTASQELGKDDFLKLLLTQLSKQDPLNPLDNNQFIAQMAQFSTLEQMTNMSADFSKLASMLSSSEAAGVIGKNVEITDGDNVVTGTVQAATRGNNPQILVNGMYYGMDQIAKMYGN